MVFDKVKRIMLLVRVMPCQTFGVMYKLRHPCSAVIRCRIDFGIDNVIVKAINGNRVIRGVVFRVKYIPYWHCRKRFASVIRSAYMVSQGVTSCLVWLPLLYWNKSIYIQ